GTPRRPRTHRGLPGAGRSVPARVEALEERRGERRDVVGVAARDEVAVGDDLLVHPRRAGVGEVGADRRPRGEGASRHEVGLDEQARRVADRRDRHALVGTGAHEAHDVVVGAQLVGRVAAGDEEGIEVGGRDLAHGSVDGDGHPPLLAGELLRLGGADDGDLVTGVDERLVGGFELDVLEVVGEDDRDLRHGASWGDRRPRGRATHPVGRQTSSRWSRYTRRTSASISGSSIERSRIATVLVTARTTSAALVSRRSNTSHCRGPSTLVTRAPGTSRGGPGSTRSTTTVRSTPCSDLKAATPPS